MDIQINFVLCGVALFLLLSAAGGYQKGLVKSVISILTILIALFAVGLIVTIISSYAGKQFAELITAIALLMILLMVSQLSRLIFASFKFLSKLPVISWVDKLAGFCFGFGKGILSVWIFFMLLVMFSSNSISEYILAAVKDSELLQYLYENNFIMELLMIFIG